MRLVEGKEGELSKWLCSDCGKIHILTYKKGRSRGPCYACQAVRRAKLTGKQPKSPGKPAKRICLLCEKIFESADICNRRCAECEKELEDAKRSHFDRTPLRYMAPGKTREVSD